MSILESHDGYFLVVLVLRFALLLFLCGFSVISLIYGFGLRIFEAASNLVSLEELLKQYNVFVLYIAGLLDMLVIVNFIFCEPICNLFSQIHLLRTKRREWDIEAWLLQLLFDEYCPPRPDSEVPHELHLSAVLAKNMATSVGDVRRGHVEKMVNSLLKRLVPELVDMIYARLRAYDIMKYYHKTRFHLPHLNRRLRGLIPASGMLSCAEKLYQRNYIPMVHFRNAFKHYGVRKLVDPSCNNLFARLLRTGLKGLRLVKVQLDVVFDDSSREVLSVDLKRCGDTVQLYLKVTNNEGQWEGREPVRLTATSSKNFGNSQIRALFYDKKANLLCYVKSDEKYRAKDTKLFLCQTSGQVQFSRRLVEINSCTSAIHLSAYGDHVFLAVPNQNITLWYYYNLKTDQHHSCYSREVPSKMVQVENTMLVHTLTDVRLLRVDDGFKIVWKERKLALVQLNDRTCMLYKTVAPYWEIDEARVLHYKAAGWDYGRITVSIGHIRFQRCSDHIFASVYHTSPIFYFHEVFNGEMFINQITF